MQASEALNETRLPRAIVRQSADLKAKYGGAVNRPPEPEPSPAADPTPSQDVAAAPTVEPPPATEADPRENDPQYWKHRFKVTEGVLRAERNDRKAQAAVMNQRITELMDEVRQLQATTPTPPTDLGKFFTPEQVEEMGEDVARAHMSAIERHVKDEVGKVIEAELKPLRHAQARTAEDEANDRKAVFLDKLGELVPDYAEIDVPGPFHDWLATENDDGVKRQEILDRHVGALNAQAVAKIFASFKRTQERPTPPIAPNGSGATPTAVLPKQHATSPPSRDEIKAFYKAKTFGKVTPEQIARFEERMKLL